MKKRRDKENNVAREGMEPTVAAPGQLQPRAFFVADGVIYFFFERPLVRSPLLQLSRVFLFSLPKYTRYTSRKLRIYTCTGVEWGQPLGKILNHP